MRIIGLGMVAVALTFCGCLQVGDVELVPNRIPVGFSVYTNMTRAQADVTSSNLGSFSVTAVGNGDIFFNGVNFTKSTSGDYSGKWCSSPVWYWPIYNLTFYAYNVPASGTGYSFSPSFNAETETGNKIDVTIPTTQTNQQDLVAAYNNDVAVPTSAGASTQLTFKHYTSQVTVQAACSNSNYTVKVKAVRFFNLYKTGTWTFSTGKFAASTDASDKAAFPTAEFTTAKTLTSTVAEMAAADGDRWYLLPQTAAKWTTATKPTISDTYLAFYLNITTATGGKIFPPTGEGFAWTAVPLSTGDFTFEAGKKYTFKVNFFANGGAGYSDPKDGPEGAVPAKGDPLVKSTNPIMFSIDSGTGVGSWKQASDITISL